MTIALQSIIDHADSTDQPEFVRWAIEWLGIDVVAEWGDLTDAGRDQLVTLSIVDETDDFTVDCTDADTWQSDWRHDSGAAYPEYTLALSSPGMETIEVRGWHLVGLMGPDGRRRSAEWGEENDDGACNGLPRADGWTIKSGDNVGDDACIMCWRSGDGRLLTLDSEHLSGWHGGRLDQAAAEADHGSEPDWSDVTTDDMERHDSRSILQDGSLVEVDILTGGIAGSTVYDHDTDRDVTCYHAVAWSHSLADDETYATRSACLAAISELADDETVHRTESAALAALAERCIAAHGEPDGLTTGCDDNGFFIAVDVDDSDEEEKYHPDASELTRIYLAGWTTIADALIEAFGVRAALAVGREWQAEADALLTAIDPLVGLEDSLTAGNCPHGTDSFARTLAVSLGASGPLGAVRASVILSVRDDRYTRRACRVAAHRYLSQD